MDENELKAIWQKHENLSFQNIDFEMIKQKSSKSQHDLRRRIRNEVMFGAVLYLLLLPIFYFYPKVMMLIPLLIALWIWYLWELKRLFNLDTEFQNFENLSQILQTRRNYLRTYFRRTRYITIFGMPLLVIFSFVILASWELIIQNPTPFLRTLIFVQIVVIVCVEFLLWLIYRPMLDETEDLLRQLNETQ